MMSLEPYVSAKVAAEFMGVTKRQLLERARAGYRGSLPIQRRTAAYLAIPVVGAGCSD